MLLFVAVIVIGIPVFGDVITYETVVSPGDSPEPVEVTIYIVDFNRFDVGAGSVGVDFYLQIRSDSNLSISDFELMNGVITSTNALQDTPHEKEYRIIAILTVEPDLSRYPFDRHTLSIKLEPKFKNKHEMVLLTNQEKNGINPEADLPGWTFTRNGSSVTNMTYMADEQPYSRIIFEYGIVRDTTSTIVKFFLPLLLIVLVSLSSLMMKISTRMGLNSSMFLAAVMIHWRIADNIPLVTYATILDWFMIITYATLVMVLVSGIFINRYSEVKNQVRVEQISFWSARIIPTISIMMYLLLVLSLIISG
ncbi:MAG: hypothetical protein LUQ50_11865 [Methanospirillum sp.]|uniref:hypothetical protein n=1 Tax=Methanospirillum sp. TaxID=45200 RepID=UPI002375590C|nr:hypothetical protein [Methanospirillum sp.]MDD1729751.1 hypothetical protein [Methanospirillum sp.]